MRYFILDRVPPRRVSMATNVHNNSNFHFLSQLAIPQEGSSGSALGDSI